MVLVATLIKMNNAIRLGQGEGPSQGGGGAAGGGGKEGEGNRGNAASSIYLSLGPQGTATSTAVLLCR